MPAVAQTVRHYRILDRLGAGGMGVVYKAEDTKLGRTVALKFLPPGLTSDEASKQRFLVEARAASKLDHPNICTIHEIGEDEEGQLFIAMAHYEGETLVQTIARGRLEAADSVAIVRQIADGLAAAHRAGIIHRDIKPANILVTPAGVVKILDFGLAKLTDISMTRSRTSVGTAAYMAPEQIRVETVTPATDVWSLGILFYELLTGARPFRADSEQAVLYSILNDSPAPMHSLQPDIPLQLESIVQKMLEKEPAARYQSMGELIGDLTPTSTMPAAEEEPRFTPGSIIGHRYRIVSLLGEGGMGQVYRADDLKLGQRVALKYIPRSLTDDALAFARVCAEVRLGRELSHPNICRIFDIVDVGKHHFIAMEYIDGEDLASLLRRIGRLPPDKALSLTRDLAAGLAAAHDRGIVHRDLKPANIMVDGEGRGRITDFGLAALAEELSEQREFAGTPAYMAPEQLERGVSTVRSDIYSLGLIVFEMFTGRQLFDASSIEEIRQQHDSSRRRLASAARSIDPVVEKIVAKCAEENPEERYANVHSVIAALPGGDALAAAIAAGETPTPGMVAASSDAGELDARRGWILLGFIAVTLLLTTFGMQRTTLLGYTSEVRSADALGLRAREVEAAFGYPPGRFVRLVGYQTNNAYLDSIARSATEEWDRLRKAPPSPYRCLVRTSPIRFVPGNRVGSLTRDDPAEWVPGMESLEFDHEGRLVNYRRVPDPRSGVAAPDWLRAFAQADLEIARFTKADPIWVPPYGFDARAAWTGSHASQPQLRLRVEAATLRGRIVYFHVIEPWDRPLQIPETGWSAGDVIALLVMISGVLLAVLARLNVTRGRADLRGASRIAIFVAIVRFAGNSTAAVPVLAPYAIFTLSIRLIGSALFFGSFAALAYLAVEPYVRRRWPRILVSLSRILRGQLRDPMFGRDVLIGTALASAMVAGYQGLRLLLNLAHLDVVPPRNPLSDVVAGLVYDLTVPMMIATAWSLGWVGILLLLRLVTPNDFGALAGLAILLSIPGLMFPAAADKIIGAIFAIVCVWCLYRFGVVAVSVLLYMRFVIANAPLTLDFSAWYAPRAIAIVLFVLAIGVWAFHVSLAGKPALGGILSDEPA